MLVESFIFLLLRAFKRALELQRDGIKQAPGRVYTVLLLISIIMHSTTQVLNGGDGSADSWTAHQRWCDVEPIATSISF